MLEYRAITNRLLYQLSYVGFSTTYRLSISHRISHQRFCIGTSPTEGIVWRPVVTPSQRSERRFGMVSLYWPVNDSGNTDGKSRVCSWQASQRVVHAKEEKTAFAGVQRPLGRRLRRQVYAQNGVDEIAVALVAVCPFLASQSAPQSSQPAPQVGQPAPDFTLNDSAGSPVKLSAYKGKVVLLDFWATWCTGCKVEKPDPRTKRDSDQPDREAAPNTRLRPSAPVGLPARVTRSRFERRRLSADRGDTVQRSPQDHRPVQAGTSRGLRLFDRLSRDEAAAGAHPAGTSGGEDHNRQVAANRGDREIRLKIKLPEIGTIGD